MSNAHGGAGNGTVSAFRDGWDGRLTSIGASPFADHQTAPCWVEISHDGRYLFAVNTAQPSISSYAINHRRVADAARQHAVHGPGRPGAGRRPAEPGRETLSVVDSGTDQVSTFHVLGGTLTELASSPAALPAGSAPFGIVTG